MAADAAHARRRGGAPRRDALHAVHSLQALRHLAERRGLLGGAPHRGGGFLRRRRIRLRRGRRHRDPPGLLSRDQPPNARHR